MKAVKNIDKHDLEISYNFFTYTFPKDQAVMVDSPELIKHLEENFPFSFSFGGQIQPLKGERFPEVKKVKTKAFIKTEESFVMTEKDMYAEQSKPDPTFGKPEEMVEGSVDTDGVEWYGKGIETDEVGKEI